MSGKSAHMTCQAFEMFTVLTFLLCILCQYVIVCYKCQDVYFDIVDMLVCPEHCAECSLHNSCMVCQENVSGSSCRSLCKVGCVIANVPNGTLLRGCHKERVDNECCMSCPPYSFCSMCSQFYGPCLRCSNALYGSLTHCDKKCGNCRPDRDGSLECDIHTGSCPGECKHGYFGIRCDLKCNENCLDHETETRKCDKHTGDCISGCIAGGNNDICEDTCSNTCFNRSCDKQSGTCSSGCISGWYGSTCEQNCSKTCANRSCDQNTGHCMNGCIPGRHGVTCEEVCPTTCSNTVCNQSSGQCDGGCIYGWYGDWCEALCSKLCFNRVCIQNSGRCENGCVLGSYGYICKNTCSSTCYNNTCNQLNEDCIFGCVTGWFGNKCDEPCSQTCSNRSCNQVSGNCEKGCISGYYGDNCDSNCSETRILQSVDNSTNKRHGCWPVGDFRTQNSVNFQYSTLITYSLVGIASVTVCALTICFIRRTVFRRKRSTENDVEVPTTSAHSEQMYDEIDDTHDSTTCETVNTELDSGSTIKATG